MPSCRRVSDLVGFSQKYILSPTEAAEIKVGDFIDHPKFGKGNVILLEGAFTNRIATVRFASAGEKKLMLNFVKVKKLVREEEKK